MSSKSHPGEAMDNTHFEYDRFPIKFLPKSFRAYVEEASESIGCYPVYIALPLLTAAGTVIGNARRLRVKNTWHALPTLWSILVGQSGTGKSPALDEALIAIQSLEREALHQNRCRDEQYREELSRYEKDLAVYKKLEEPGSAAPEEPDAPISKRYLLQDTTIEALAPILQSNPKGILVWGDELSGWFLSFNRYSGKPGADEATWLALYNGNSITVDRKATGTQPLHVPSAVVSICGGIQPEILYQVFTPQYLQSGLAARFLIANPPRRLPLWTDTELSLNVRQRVISIFRSLASLEMHRHEDGVYESKLIEMDPLSRELWIDYFNTHQREQEQLEGALSAAYSKLIGYVPRFALLLHLISQAEKPDQETVCYKCMSNAIELADWFKREARRAYCTLASGEDQKHLQKRLSWIQRNFPNGITARDYQNRQQGIKTAKDAETELQRLASAGLGSWDTSDARKMRFIPTQR